MSGWELKVISIKLPREILNIIDYLVERGVYVSRSSLIRDAIRRLLLELLKDKKIDEIFKRRFYYEYSS